MKLAIYSTVLNFIEQFEENNEANAALQALIRRSFPKHFGNDEPTLIQYLKRNTYYGQLKDVKPRYRFDNEDVTSYVAFDDGKVVGFAQTVLEKGDRRGIRKLRLINLCRVRYKRYKGLGAALMAKVNEYSRTEGHTIIYLSVTAKNSKLQLYYQTLGWMCTGVLEFNNVEPTFEYTRLLK
jgi:GNAT superfamily N-acetyltransferase